MQDYTGVAAIFETGRPGPVLAIRFDMDCVDVDEAHEAGHRPFDEGWASTNPGHMHSCGHDGHATMGIAVCNDSGKFGPVLRHDQGRLPAC